MRWWYAAEKENDLSRWMKRGWSTVEMPVDKCCSGVAESVYRITVPAFIYTRRRVGYQLSHGEIKWAGL